MKSIFSVTTLILVSTLRFTFCNKVDSVVTKYHHRRAAGILGQPRVGRTTHMTAFSRSDSSSGLVHYPRVGRSNQSFTSDMNNDETKFTKLLKIINEYCYFHSTMNFGRQAIYGNKDRENALEYCMENVFSNYYVRIRDNILKNKERLASHLTSKSCDDNCVSLWYLLQDSVSIGLAKSKLLPSQDT